MFKIQLGLGVLWFFFPHIWLVLFLQLHSMFLPLVSYIYLRKCIIALYTLTR